MLIPTTLAWHDVDMALVAVGYKLKLPLSVYASQQRSTVRYVTKQHMTCGYTLRSINRT